jgi:2-methylisocitrate lyase-like PEP mutase family enzyme
MHHHRSASATFHALHQHDQLLVLPTAWDAASAALSCGYADGGTLPHHLLLQRVAEIAAAVSVPLSVDLEDGYSHDPDAVARLVERIAALGVAGINLEDGGDPPSLLVAKLDAIRARLGERRVFINARTDIYLGGLARGDAAVRMSRERLCRYAQAGADGGFVPGLCEPAQIAALAAGIPVPLNIMTVPGLADLPTLRAAGVRRLSAGPALFLGAFAHAFDAGRAFIDAGHLPQVAATAIDYAAMNALHRPRDAAIDASAARA